MFDQSIYQNIFGVGNIGTPHLNLKIITLYTLYYIIVHDIVFRVIVNIFLSNLDEK